MVGQPFDLIKVRMQTSPPGTYKSTMDAVSSVFKKEGPLAFYKVSSHRIELTLLARRLKGS